MRLLKTIIILAVLVAFPALSWYYLNRGLSWRVDAKAEIENKQSMPDLGAIIDRDSTVIYFRDIRDRYLIVCDPAKGTIGNLEKIHEQFKDRDDFAILQFPSRETALADLEHAKTIDCRAQCDDLKSSIFPTNHNAAVLDDSLYLRHTYDLRDRDQASKLVEHMALLFPFERRPKVELRRNAK